MLKIYFLQIYALPSEESNVAAHKQNNHALVDVRKSVAALKGLYNEARTTLSKFQSCGTETHLEMFRLAALKFDDFHACVNATREIADYEEFLFDFYYYVEFVKFTFVDLYENVYGCRHQSGFINIINCTLTEFQNSGTDFDYILSRAKYLVAEVKTDTDDLILYVKRCLGYTSSELLTEMHTLIKNNC